METKFSSKQKSFLIKEIRLLEKRVVRESINLEGKFILHMFLALSLSDPFSLILNVKRLKKFLPYVYFKMQKTNSTLAVITPGYYIAKVDIKDAYYSVAIFLYQQFFF